MITALIIIAVLLAAVTGWHVNNLTSGRRLRRRLARYQDEIQQKLLTDVTAAVKPEIPRADEDMPLVWPVIVDPSIPRDRVIFMSPEWLQEFNRNAGRDQRR